MSGISNPTRSNPVTGRTDSGSNVELPNANAPLPPAHHLGIHQRNSLSPYHQHRQHQAPSGPGYYYNYNPPPHPHEQQPHGSPVPIQQQQQRYNNGLHPSAYMNSPYHHGQQEYSSQYGHHSGQHGRHHHQHCSYGGGPPSASATDAWPAPPSSSEEIANMDTTNEGNEHQRQGASSTLCRSHSPRAVATATTAVLEEDTSNLATLANASMASMSRSPPPYASSSSSSSSTPSPSSSPTTARGPLKKRRKVDEHVTKEEKDAAAAAAKSKASDMSGKKKILDCESLTVVRSMDSSNSAINTNTKNVDGFSNNDSAPSNSRLKSFPMMLHKLLTEGNDPEREHNRKVQMENEGSRDAATATVELSTANASASVANNAISLAMEWLPHGKGFRILRWDALCAILPKQFPQLCEDAALAPKQVVLENTEKKTPKEEAVDHNVIVEREMEEEHKVEFSDDQWIEAFLWHTQLWGLTEVKAGADRASFRHESFLRESPEQCHKMKRSNHGGHTSGKESSKRLSSRNGSGHYTEIGYTTSSDPHDQTPVDTTARPSSWRNKNHTNKNISSIFKPRTIYSASTTHHHCPLQQQPQQHPSYLHVPTLASCATASFSNDAAPYWAGGGNNNEHHVPDPGNGEHHHGHQNGSYQHPPPPQQQQHAHYLQYLAPPPPPPPSYPTPPMRSPKMIRFRDDITESYHHTSDVAVEITPNPDDHLQEGEEASSSQPLLLSRGTNSGNEQQHHGRSTSLRGTVSRRGRRPALISRHATN